jgi:hypothetical protein
MTLKIEDQSILIAKTKHFAEKKYETEIKNPDKATLLAIGLPLDIKLLATKTYDFTDNPTTFKATDGTELGKIENEIVTFIRASSSSSPYELYANYEGKVTSLGWYPFEGKVIYIDPENSAGGNIAEIDWAYSFGIPCSNSKTLRVRSPNYKNDWWDDLEECGISYKSTTWKKCA